MFGQVEIPEMPVLIRGAWTVVEVLALLTAKCALLLALPAK